jgi:hypothetical protein
LPAVSPAIGHAFGVVLPILGRAAGLVVCLAIIGVLSLVVGVLVGWGIGTLGSAIAAPGAQLRGPDAAFAELLGYVKF